MSRQSQRPKARQFSANLRALVRHRGWTQREAAERLGIDYLTLRKYLNSGLANLTEKNRPVLDAICKEFGIERIEMLWAKKLESRRQPDVEMDAATDGVVWQLRILCRSFRDDPIVQHVIRSVDNAFEKLVCGATSSKGRASGKGGIDTGVHDDADGLDARIDESTENKEWVKKFNNEHQELDEAHWVDDNHEDEEDWEEVDEEAGDDF